MTKRGQKLRFNEQACTREEEESDAAANRVSKSVT